MDAKILNMLKTMPFNGQEISTDTIRKMYRDFPDNYIAAALKRTDSNDLLSISGILEPYADDFANPMTIKGHLFRFDNTERFIELTNAKCDAWDEVRFAKTDDEARTAFTKFKAIVVKLHDGREF